MSRCPTRKEVISKVSDTIFSGRVLNNSHRGDVVEMMVAMALGAEWCFVGLGWHPWDLQRGAGDDRVRIQVKQSAALQLWGPTKVPTVSLNWSARPPSYFRRDNPDELIEAEGWFCELFVVGIHSEKDAAIADQCDPQQWRFSVIPTPDLKEGAKSITVNRIIARWPPVEWGQLKQSVDKAVRVLALAQYEFWQWDDHGLIRCKRDGNGGAYPEVWRGNRWETGTAYAVDAITGMGEDPYSCGECAEPLSIEQAQEYAAANQVDLLGPNQSKKNSR